MKKITILGSTGSIGRSALDVISRHEDRFRVVALAAGSNYRLLLEQIRRFNPEIVAVADESAARRLKDSIKGSRRPKILPGEEGIIKAASYEKADFVLSAIVGFAGLLPTLSAVRAGKTVGLANKESLVTAGEILMKEAAASGARILPVDSEHSAVLQCMEGYSRKSLKRIILTASGGPFLNMKAGDMAAITPEDALRHPNWNMGKKISIDSATLMNKGLEVIEAHYLFGIPPVRIEVIVHPQSIIHSMVEFLDGSCIAQLSVPDMRGAIAYAMSYPERLNNVVSGLDLSRIGRLTFQSPDNKSFPSLSYAYDALGKGGTMPAVLNASNEIAVCAFLDGEIRFRDIPVIIKRTMDSHKVSRINGLAGVINADRWAREKATEILKRYRRAR